MKEIIRILEEKTKIIDTERFIEESLSEKNILDQDFSEYNEETESGIVKNDCTIEVPSYLTNDGNPLLIRFTEIENIKNGIVEDSKIIY